MKICIKCKQARQIEEYHKHSGMKSGRLNKCKFCVLQDVSAWRKENPQARVLEYKKQALRLGIRTRKDYFLERFPNPVGTKVSSLKYSHKRHAKLRAKNLSELDLFVFEEAVLLSSLRELATGFKWSVDHIVPLYHKDACGLHVASNFQVVPAIWNSKKGNRNMETYLNEISGY